MLPMFLARRRALEEKGHEPLYETYCPGVYGFAGTNIPSIRLAIYDTFLVVAWLSPRVIRLADIEEAKMSRFFPVRYVLIKPRSGLALRLNVKDPERVLQLIKLAQPGAPADPRSARPAER